MKKLNLPDKLNALKGLADKFQSDKQKIILAAFFALLIGYADYAFIIKSQLRVLKNKETKIIKLKKDIGALNKALAAMKDTKPTPAAKIKEMITEEKVTSLLQDISDMANKNNIKIIQIKPSRELKEKAAMAKPAKEKAAKVKTPTASSESSTLTITLDLVCNYPSLNNFINALENSNVLIIVQGIKIAGDPGNYLQQNVNLVLKTYVKK